MLPIIADALGLKRDGTGMRIGLPGLVLVALALGSPVCAASAPPPPRSCLPPGLPQPAPAPRQLPIDVYFDGSQSMSGFAEPGPSAVRPLGDLLRLLADQGAPVRYHAFGKAIADLTPARAALYDRPQVYNCKACDNQESWIDDVLRAVARAPADRLSIVVTDLWLDNHAFHGSLQVAFGGPLAKLIVPAPGAAAVPALAVLGIRAPYRGRIYDLPGGGSPRFDGERPLFVLIAGPEREVAALRAMLRDSHSPAFNADHLREAVFTAGGTARLATPPVPVGGGVTTAGPLAGAADVAHYRFDRALAARQRGAIAGRYAPGLAVTPGEVWRGPPAAASRVWVMGDAGALARCAPGAWRALPPLRGSWRVGGPGAGGNGSGAFRFDATNSAAMSAGEAYLVAGSIGTAALATPNPDTQWLRDWSLPADAAGFAASRPRLFKTLGLADLATLMEADVTRATPRGRALLGFQFAVSVE